MKGTPSLRSFIFAFADEAGAVGRGLGTHPSDVRVTCVHKGSALHVTASDGEMSGWPLHESIYRIGSINPRFIEGVSVAIRGAIAAELGRLSGRGAA